MYPKDVVGSVVSLSLELSQCLVAHELRCSTHDTQALKPVFKK